MARAHSQTCIEHYKASTYFSLLRALCLGWCISERQGQLPFHGGKTTGELNEKDGDEVESCEVEDSDS
jgi:hypothetical protein